MLDKNLISYNHEESIVHSLNPVVKLVSFVLFIIACFFKYDTYLFMALIVSVFILIMLSNIFIFKYFRIIWLFKYFLILLYVILYAQNMEFFDINVIMFKVIFSLLFLNVIIFTTKKKDLSKALALLTNIFNVIGLQLKTISGFFENIFSFISIFIDVTNDFLEMKAIKGEDVFFGSILNKVKMFFSNIKEIFKETKKRNLKRKSNMKYHLYDAKVKSQFKYRAKLNIFDYILIIFYIGIYVYYILKVR